MKSKTYSTIIDTYLRLKQPPLKKKLWWGEGLMDLTKRNIKLLKTNPETYTNETSLRHKNDRVHIVDSHPSSET